jgi:type IV secretion system protein VirD4
MERTRAQATGRAIARDRTGHDQVEPCRRARGAAGRALHGPRCPSVGIRRATLRILPLCIFGLGGSVAATQTLAHAFRNATELGEPVLSIGGAPVYAPFEWYTRRRQWARYAPKPFALPTVYALLGPVAGLLLSFGLQGRRAPEPVGAYGTARWATPDELARAGLLGDTGIVLGQLADADFQRESDGRWSITKVSRLLRHDGDGHTFVCARTRAGKGVTSVVPTLLSYTEGSVLVHDPKGENWELTAGWRSTFSHCLRFDPTSEHSVRFNPLLEVRPAPLDVRDAQNIAEILVNPESMSDQERDHWKLTGHAFLVGVILHVLYAEPDKSVAGVLRVLTDPERPVEELLQAISRR